MDIKIEKQNSKTAMFIEADFDQIVAENFGDSRRSNVGKQYFCRNKKNLYL